MSTSIKLFRLLSLLFLAAAPAAQSIQLRDGSVLVGEIQDVSAEGMTFHRLDTGGMLDLRWEDLSSESAVRIKHLKGNVAGSAGTRAAFAASQQRVADVRASAVGLVQEVSGDTAFTDVNYVFPTFITTRLPIGLVGLLIAAVFAAAMSSIAAELNALSAATVIDFYRRHLKPEASDRHYLFVSKLSTAFWGVFATVFALYAANLGSLIEVVNRVGSYFYGSLLGVFVLAIAVPRATANGAFWGLLAGMAVVGLVEATTEISFIWFNVVGTVAVVVVGTVISLLQPAPEG